MRRPRFPTAMALACGLAACTAPTLEQVSIAAPPAEAQLYALRVVRLEDGSGADLSAARAAVEQALAGRGDEAEPARLRDLAAPAGRAFAFLDDPVRPLPAVDSALGPLALVVLGGPELGIRDFEAPAEQESDEGTGVRLVVRPGARAAAAALFGEPGYVAFCSGDRVLLAARIDQPVAGREVLLLDVAPGPGRDLMRDWVRHGAPP